MSDQKKFNPPEDGTTGGPNDSQPGVIDTTEYKPNGADPQAGNDDGFDFGSYENGGDTGSGDTTEIPSVDPPNGECPPDNPPSNESGPPGDPPSDPPRDEGREPGRSWRRTGSWIYIDAQGAPVYKIDRLEDGSIGVDGKPKKITPYSRADGHGGWISGQGCMDKPPRVPRVPYRLPDLLKTIGAGMPIAIVQGEKCADLCWAAGIPATSSHSWTLEIARWFSGATAAILPDNDEAGANEAKRTAKALHGTAAALRIVALPGLSHKEDIEQWLARGGTADALWELAGEAPDYAPPAGEGATAGDTTEERVPWSFATEARVRSALRFISNDGDRNGDWLKVAMALHSTGWSNAATIFVDWSKGSPKFDPAAAERLWKSFHLPKPGEKFIGLSSLFKLAREAGWKDEPDPLITQKRDIEPTYFSVRDPALIPRRRWLYGRFYLREQLSASFAAGGTGKTSINLVEAVAMAAGRPLLNHEVKHPCRIWYWNGEDPASEIELRIAAILQHFGVTAEEISDRLIIDVGRTLPIELVNGKVELTGDPAAITETMVKHKIDVLVLDPFVRTHSVSENDNVAINKVASCLKNIAEEANCSVALVHHVRKQASGAGAEITADDGRGASSLKDAARCVRTMSTMTAEEAEKVGIDERERKRFFRVDFDAKANMAPPAGEATWFELKSIYLPANDSDPEYDAGDSIGVATSWKPSGTLEAVSTEQADAIKAAIANGVAGDPTKAWGAHPAAGDWVGYPIATVLGLNVDDVAQKRRTERMIKEWLKLGCLKKDVGLKPNRHPRPIIVLGTASWVMLPEEI
jgi:hypothetical protein